MAGIKTTPADQWFSKCVRERNDWKCERCNTYYPPGKTAGLDCSHYYSRSDKSIRHYPHNAFAHCRGCHQWLSSRPEEFARHYRDVFGEDALTDLIEIKQDIDRGRAVVKDQKSKRSSIASHYKLQYEMMREARNAGRTGRIEFEDYDWRDL